MNSTAIDGGIPIATEYDPFVEMAAAVAGQGDDGGTPGEWRFRGNPGDCFHRVGQLPSEDHMREGGRGLLIDAHAHIQIVIAGAATSTAGNRDNIFGDPQKSW